MENPLKIDTRVHLRVRYPRQNDWPDLGRRRCSGDEWTTNDFGKEKIHARSPEMHLKVRFIRPAPNTRISWLRSRKRPDNNLRR